MQKQQSPLTRPSSPLLAIGLFILAQSFGSLNGALSRVLTAEVPVLMIVWGRFVGFVLLVIFLALHKHGWEAVAPPNPRLHFFRGLFLLAATVFFVGAVSGMPLADATALVFIYPFLVTAVAPFVLGERISAGTWFAVAAGFAGVLIVLRPDMGGVNWYGLLAMAGGASFGCHLLITRRLTASSPPLVTATSTALVGLALLSIVMPFVWQSPNWTQIWLMAMVALSATIGQMLTILAFTRAETSTLAPFGYSEIVSATIYGYLLFGDLPDRIAWLGIFVIAASGVYIALAASGRRLPLVSRTRPPAS